MWGPLPDPVMAQEKGARKIIIAMNVNENHQKFLSWSSCDTLCFILSSITVILFQRTNAIVEEKSNVLCNTYFLIYVCNKYTICYTCIVFILFIIRTFLLKTCSLPVINITLLSTVYLLSAWLDQIADIILESVKLESSELSVQRGRSKCARVCTTSKRFTEASSLLLDVVPFFNERLRPCWFNMELYFGPAPESQAASRQILLS